MKLDRWLWRLQVALIASAPLLAAVAVVAFFLTEGTVRYEHVYEDGTRVETFEHANPFDRWINLVVILLTALWQLGMGAALFCLRRIGHTLAVQREALEPQDGVE